MAVRFSMKTVLALPVLVAMACAGLLYPNVVLAACLFLVALVLVLTGVAGAVFSRGPTRAYWIGFALFGATYLALAFYFERNISVVEPSIPLGSRLPTTELVLWGYGKIYSLDVGSTTRLNVTRVRPRMMVANDRFYLPSGEFEHLATAGHAVFTALLAWIGGAVAAGFHRRMSRSTE
jgi:hypothetical protein